ncbi:MAG: FAD-binding oxidoreductase [Alphaproteobacteria bacterium]|nr:FAD-binding oxidoreductase [Alphaproteobacteria bacterium]
MKPSIPLGYYTASATPISPFPRLAADTKADVCIIGGGYTGLSAALHLAQAGARICLVEAKTVGSGASGRNGGQIHTGLRKEQAWLERRLGKVHARALWDLSEDAKDLIRKLVAELSIACDLKPGVVVAAHNRRAVRALAEDTDHLARNYGYRHGRMLDGATTAQMLGTDVYPAARFDEGGGHLHPLRFVRGLAAAAARAGATLWENTPAQCIERHRSKVVVRCRGARITADRVLLACDAFSAGIAPKLAGYIGTIESFLMATAPLGEALNREILPCDAAVADTRHVLDYYRKSVDGRLLFAGGEAGLRHPKDIVKLVRPRMLRVFPALSGIPIAYAWSGTVGITRSRLPHFGKLSERVFFAHGYSGQGVALAVLGGKLLAEAAMGQRERFDVFARIRTKAFPGGALLRKPLLGAALAISRFADTR